MRLVLLTDLHFMCIFIGAVKSELLTSHFKVTLEDLTSYQIITLLLQSEQLTLTLLVTTVYLYTYPTLPLATAYPLSVCQNV